METAHRKISAIAGIGLGLCWLAGCNFSDVFSLSDVFNDPSLELQSQTRGQPKFQKLEYNPKWYRTYDSLSTIIPAAGSLLFGWSYVDSMQHPDSFYVGIDTLWTLPQDMGGDTANDWDLQVCPDGFCMNGLKANVHGANAPIHFGGTGEFADNSFKTEHHFQFWPAISPTGENLPIAPANNLFGAMMFVRSLSSGQADTVFAFGAWGLGWDSTSLPPVHPVGGYLPRRSDFTIVGNKVRYTH